MDVGICGAVPRHLLAFLVASHDGPAGIGDAQFGVGILAGIAPILKCFFDLIQDTDRRQDPYADVIAHGNLALQRVVGCCACLGINFQNA